MLIEQKLDDKSAFYAVATVVDAEVNDAAAKALFAFVAGSLTI